jgi:hypothetical protein
MFEKNVYSLDAIVQQILKYAAVLVVYVSISPFLLYNFNENVTRDDGTSREDQLRVVHTDVRKERFVRYYNKYSNMLLL